MEDIISIIINGDIGFIIFLTFKIALIATIITLIIGFLLAYILTFKKFFGREILDICIQFPLIIPPSILGYYLLILFSQKGMIGKVLYRYFNFSIIFTWYGGLVAAIVVSMPFMVRSIKSALESLDKSVLEAAKVDQANELQILIYIIFPMVKRGILAGILLSFTRAMGEFGATLMVSGNIPGKTQTMSLAIYQATAAGNYTKANILVGILTAISFLILWIIKSRFKLEV